MFSKELEALIEATLADGVLEDNEKAALVKRAQAEGVDLAELEIYINSIMQKRMQTKTAEEEARDQAAAAKKKEAVGRTCPHCGTVIPPLAEKCPGCGEWVMTASLNEKIEKEFDLIRNEMGEALQKTSGVPRANAVGKVKPKVMDLQIRYASIPKVQTFCNMMMEQINEAEEYAKKLEKGLYIYMAVFVIVAIIACICMAIFK